MFTLDDIQEGMLVIALNDDYYDGLVGYIDVIRKDKSTFESENDTEFEIVTDLHETDDMKKTHPDLNGTGVGQLIMGEDDLVFFPNGPDGKGYDIEGKEYGFWDLVFPDQAYKKQISSIV